MGLGRTVGPPEVHVIGDERMLALLRRAFDAGIRYINTAEAYENEAILGRLLPLADPPADLLISTKFGHGKGFSADQFRVQRRAHAARAAAGRIAADVRARSAHF